jgi:hypothetical protein
MPLLAGPNLDTVLSAQFLKLQSMPTPPRLDLSAQQVKAVSLHRNWPEPSQS